MVGRQIGHTGAPARLSSTFPFPVMPPPSLPDLPLNILKSILARLEPSDIGKLAQTCRALRKWVHVLFVSAVEDRIPLPLRSRAIFYGSCEMHCWKEEAMRLGAENAPPPTVLLFLNRVHSKTRSDDDYFEILADLACGACVGHNVCMAERLLAPRKSDQEPAQILKKLAAAVCSHRRFNDQASLTMKTVIVRVTGEFPPLFKHLVACLLRNAPLHTLYVAFAFGRACGGRPFSCRRQATAANPSCKATAAAVMGRKNAKRSLMGYGSVALGHM